MIRPPSSHRWKRCGPCGKGKGTGTSGDGLVQVEAVKRNEGESCLWVGDQKYKAVKKKVKNKKGADGKVLTCFTCKSEYHFSQDCPKAKEEGDKPKRGEKRKLKKQDSSSEESGSNEDLLLVEEQEYLLAAGEVRAFTWEARGASALDSCCTASVCGQEWMNMFLEELEEQNMNKVEGPYVSEKSFGFGNNAKLKSKRYYIIPVEEAGRMRRMKVEVIESDIPLLMSRKAMEKVGIILDFKEKKITVLGKTIPMLQTSSGQPIMRVQPSMSESWEEIFMVINFETGSRTEQKKGLKKLYKQFGHMPLSRFVDFLK